MPSFSSSGNLFHSQLQYLCKILAASHTHKRKCNLLAALVRENYLIFEILQSSCNILLIWKLEIKLIHCINKMKPHDSLCTFKLPVFLCLQLSLLVDGISHINGYLVQTYYKLCRHL